MFRRFSAHAVVAAGLVLSVATSTVENDYQSGVATSNAVSLGRHTISEDAPLLLAVHVTVEGDFYTEVDGARTPVEPTDQIFRMYFQGDWVTEAGGTFRLKRGSAGSCVGSATGVAGGVPGPDSTNVPPPSLEGFVPVSDTEYHILVDVDGDPVFTGELLAEVTLEAAPPVGGPSVRSDVAVTLTVESLDCHAAPPDDTADDTGADTADSG